MHHLLGVVQNYEWGDRYALPKFLGVAPDSKPWAEVWFGTHRGGPSQISTSSGPQTLESDAGALSFLVKVIAAAKPLSLQTHPTDEQARAGFANENARGIALDHPERLYRDISAKPELLIAITEFEAICGFRSDKENLKMCEQYEWYELAKHLREDGLAQCVRWALTSGPKTLPDKMPYWAMQLADLYPGSGGVLVALLMHHVRVRPGDALYLGAGNVHAYLRGEGVEVMSSSDNVVRAAFTQKHVDIEAFLKIADLSPIAKPLCAATRVDDCASQYLVGTQDFGTQRIKLVGQYTVTATHDIEILICTTGDAGTIKRGQAGVIKRGETLQLSGDATVFKTWGKS